MPSLAKVRQPPTRGLRLLVGCQTVSEELPLMIDGSRRPTPAVAEHLETCLTCQAEKAVYGRLLKVLRAMDDDVLPAAGLFTGTLAFLDQAPGRRGWYELAGRVCSPRIAVAAVAGAAALGAGILLTLAIRRPRTVAGAA